MSLFILLFHLLFQLIVHTPTEVSFLFIHFNKLKELSHILSYFIVLIHQSHICGIRAFVILFQLVYFFKEVPHLLLVYPELLFCICLLLNLCSQLVGMTCNGLAQILNFYLLVLDLLVIIFFLLVHLLLEVNLGVLGGAACLGLLKLLLHIQ